MGLENDAAEGQRCRGDLEIGCYEARIRLQSPAYLSYWPGNKLRSGLGIRLKELVCIGRPDGLDCPKCPGIGQCVYDRLYNGFSGPGVGALRRKVDPPRPFVLNPMPPGQYDKGSVLSFGFSIFGNVRQSLPFILLAIRNLGNSGLGGGYRLGNGRFTLDEVSAIGYGSKEMVFREGMIYSKNIVMRYSEILEAASDYAGQLTIRFITPAQIKENDQFSSAPSFRGLISSLLSRANSLAEQYGSGQLYSTDEAIRLLGKCRFVVISSASTSEIRAERYFRKQNYEKRPIAPFFVGELTYRGEFSRDIMALLELGRIAHVGKMATFGNGEYEIIV